jgi:hypothetical protein
MFVRSFGSFSDYSGGVRVETLDSLQHFAGLGTCFSIIWRIAEYARGLVLSRAVLGLGSRAGFLVYVPCKAGTCVSWV